MSTDNQSPSVVEAVDMTKLGVREENRPSILPPALLAAKALNKKNAIGVQEVTLPVMNVVVKCSSFSNVDEATIKTMSGSISSYNDANFRLLYRHCEFPDGIINTYEEFINKLTEADFRTILYGVMKASFKNLEEMRFTCKNENCPNPDDSKIFPYTPVMNRINIEFQQENYISPSGDHTKDLFVADNDILTIKYKFDNVESKIDLFKFKSNEEIRNNIITTGLMIPKSELSITYIDSIQVKDGEQVYTISKPSDILLFIKTLDVTSREEIEKLNNRFITHIDGWIPKFSTKVQCPHCQNSQDWEDIDIYVEFFRKFTAIF